MLCSLSVQTTSAQRPRIEFSMTSWHSVKRYTMLHQARLFLFPNYFLGHGTDSTETVTDKTS
ncbi:hypothetical protein DPMN_009668 [Dreissena polymorpha]|uniref:Uncharacterized protein n=1 Tax=Dreissena polymorpha TaxID=45954 RepID=A0A9D4S0B8_DREPO|nr:hypothetical protein DPMN_009668 [Dreissena polymorpha]